MRAARRSPRSLRSNAWRRRCLVLAGLVRVAASGAGEAAVFLPVRGRRTVRHGRLWRPGAIRRAASRSSPAASDDGRARYCRGPVHDRMPSSSRAPCGGLDHGSSGGPACRGCPGRPARQRRAERGPDWYACWPPAGRRLRVAGMATDRSCGLLPARRGWRWTIVATKALGLRLIGRPTCASTRPAPGTSKAGCPLDDAQDRTRAAARGAARLAPRQRIFQAACPGFGVSPARHRPPGAFEVFWRDLPGLRCGSRRPTPTRRELLRNLAEQDDGALRTAPDQRIERRQNSWPGHRAPTRAPRCVAADWWNAVRFRDGRMARVPAWREVSPRRCGCAATWRSSTPHLAAVRAPRRLVDAWTAALESARRTR